MTELKNAILVTGGTSGLGQEIARGFATAGYDVVAAGLGEIPSDEENLKYRTLDVTDGAVVRVYLAALCPSRPMLCSARTGAERAYSTCAPKLVTAHKM